MPEILADLPREVTNIKDYGMTELWDDRAVSVETNLGNAFTDYIHPKFTTTKSAAEI